MNLIKIPITLSYIIETQPLCHQISDIKGYIRLVPGLQTFNVPERSSWFGV